MPWDAMDEPSTLLSKHSNMFLVLFLAMLLRKGTIFIPKCSETYGVCACVCVYCTKKE